MNIDQLNGIDSAFLALETGTSRMHVGVVMVLDPPEGRRSLFSPSTRYAQIRRVLQQRVHLVRAFRQRPASVAFGLGHPVWVDDPAFVLDDHLRRAAVPAPGGEAELNEVVADFMSRGLDLDRPLWELLVVEGLADGRAAVVAKLHHAIIDGMSGAALLASFLDAGPRDRPPPVFGTAAPEPGPRAPELWWHLVGRGLRAPSTVRSVVGSGISSLTHVWESGAGGDRRPVPFAVPRTALNGTISERRRFATTAIPLGDAELVRRCFGTSENDVVLAAVSGGMRRLLQERSELGDRSLVALVPMSTRRRRTGEGLGNQIAGMLVPLGTDVEDPATRLASVAANARAAKGRYRATRGTLLRDTLALSPPAIVRQLARWSNALRLFDRAPPPANLVVSSVFGPRSPLWLAGSRVVALHPVGPVAHGVGLNVTAMRYVDRIWLGLLGCGRLAPDVADLATHIEESMAELVSLAGGLGRSSAPPVATAAAAGRSARR